MRSRHGDEQEHVSTHFQVQQHNQEGTGNSSLVRRLLGKQGLGSSEEVERSFKEALRMSRVMLTTDLGFQGPVESFKEESLWLSLDI